MTFKQFEQYSMQENDEPPKQRQMSDSEMMSILIFYHHSGFKCFKYYYEQIILRAMRSY